MKVLFVCQRNNGRSQMAKGIYNSLSHTNDADSAGLMVDKNGQLLKERALEPGSDVSKVIEVMNELGIDMTESPRKQLEDESLNNYDKIVIILEPAKVPKWLKSQMHTEIWDIEDPKIKDLNGVRETRDIIAEKVRALVASKNAR